MITDQQLANALPGYDDEGPAVRTDPVRLAEDGRVVLEGGESPKDGSD